ncbi:MAG: hypothetical protein U5K73_09580 [Halofilum sp. (in: g-proteobacteria)]|nr:hypothetical protein [Halofilum sp. (in: g-proteobacteria)]
MGSVAGAVLAGFVLGFIHVFATTYVDGVVAKMLGVALMARHSPLHPAEGPARPGEDLTVFRLISIGGIALLLIGLILAPHVVGGIIYEILAIMSIHIVLAQGYRPGRGRRGLVVGRYVLMGCGAYRRRDDAKFAGWPFWLSIPFGAVPPEWSG